MSQTMLIMFGALGAELLLLAFVLLLAFWLRSRGRALRDRKAVQALVARIKQTKPQRAAAIEQYLAGQMGMSGEPLAQAKVGLLRAELFLLQRFAAIYRQRDAGAAARFDIDLFAALESYHALHGSAAAGSPEAGTTDSEPNDSDIEFLRAENSRLSDELRVTMETMSRMLNEYSTMFAGGSPTETAPISSPAGDAAGSAGAAMAGGHSVADDGTIDGPARGTQSGGEALGGSGSSVGAVDAAGDHVVETLAGADPGESAPPAASGRAAGEDVAADLYEAVAADRHSGPDRGVVYGAPADASSDIDDAGPAMGGGNGFGADDAAAADVQSRDELFDEATVDDGGTSTDPVDMVGLDTAVAAEVQARDELFDEATDDDGGASTDPVDMVGLDAAAAAQLQSRDELFDEATDDDGGAFTDPVDIVALAPDAGDRQDAVVEPQRRASRSAN